jgi:cobalt-zinc-cadmium efflux system outer membrane protein
MGVSMQIPLPVFNRNQGEIARAEAEAKQARLRLTAAQTDAAGEVLTAYEQFVTAKALLEDIEGRMIGQARDVRDITEYSYRRGDASLLEFLDAQRAFNDTIEAYNEACADYARSAHLLESASGRSLLP